MIATTTIAAACLAMLAAGPDAPGRTAHRAADAIVDELEGHIEQGRRPLPVEAFVRTHTRTADLVAELRESHPHDPRLPAFLPVRWFSLNYVGRKAEARAEVREALRTARDPALAADARFVDACLALHEPVSAAEAAAVAEAFARGAAGDDRAAGLLREAAGRLEEAGTLRLVSAGALAAAGGLALLLRLPRLRAGVRRRWKWAIRLGELGLLGMAVAAAAFRLQPPSRQAEGAAEALERLDGLAAALGRLGAASSPLLGAVGERLGREFRAVPAGLAAALAATAAVAIVALRRRRSPAPLGRARAVRLGTFGFASALAAALLLDAGLMARKASGLRDRVVRGYPDSAAGRTILGERRRRERLGEPFELEFTDAITGRKISMRGLRGKVVVVDFWATWCGPCVAEIPEMKRLYAEYHDRGVEFIGVSHDVPVEDGGLEALRKFVAREQIPWPQYYLARTGSMTGAAAGDFSESWGVSGIPVVFVVDAQGRLYSTEARGRLGTLIPRLLAEARAGDAVR